MSKSKRSYTLDFKKDAINLALRSPTVKGAADNLGVPEGTLNTWLRKAAASSNPNELNSNDNFNISEELTKLRKENARLREEREILKKAATFFAKESK